MKVLRFFSVLNGVGATDTGLANMPSSVGTNATTAVAATSAPSYATGLPPGEALAELPFLYTGEWDYRSGNQAIFVEREGKVVWTYEIPIKDENGTLQKLGDVTMLSNASIIFCRRVGASEISTDKKSSGTCSHPRERRFLPCGLSAQTTCRS